MPMGRPPLRFDFAELRTPATVHHGTRSANENTTQTERDRFAPKTHAGNAISEQVKLLVFLPQGGVDNVAYLKTCLAHTVAPCSPRRFAEQKGARPQQ